MKEGQVMEDIQVSSESSPSFALLWLLDSMTVDFQSSYACFSVRFRFLYNEGCIYKHHQTRLKENHKLEGPASRFNRKSGVHLSSDNNISDPNSSADYFGPVHKKHSYFEKSTVSFISVVLGSLGLQLFVNV